jgi:hypothetical protein
MENSKLELPRSFWKWFDGRRRKYNNKYPTSSYEEIVKLAYSDWME